MYTIRFQKKVLSLALLGVGVIVAGFILQQSLNAPVVFAQGSDSDSDSGSGAGSSGSTDSSGCGNDSGGLGGGASGTGGQASDGGGDTQTPPEDPPVVGTPSTALQVISVTCGALLTFSITPENGVTAFKVDIITDPNNPEGSVVASKTNIPASGGTHSLSFVGSSGVTYYAVEFAYRDGVWVYADVSGSFVAPTNCIPTGTLTLKTNPCTIAAGATTCQPYFDWTTANTDLGSAGRVAFNIRDVSWTGTYANETSYADSNAASGTDGAGVPLPEGIYTIKLYGFKSNDWVLLDSKTQTVDAASPPITPTGTLTLKTNPCTIAAGATTCQPYFDWTTANTNGVIQFNIIGGSTYPVEAVYAGPNGVGTSGTDGHGAVLAAGTYTIKLYGQNSANTWVLLDSEDQTVSAGLSADLTVSGITPTSAVAGTATTFSATVTNTGTGSTGIGFKNFYQVKSGTVGYTPHNLFAKLLNIAHAAETITDLAATTMSALAAGGNGTATQTYTFPAAGTYGMRVCADKEDRNGTGGNPNGLIAESDETNNCGGWTDVNVTSLCTPACSSGSVCSSGACVVVGGPCTPTNACGQSNSGTYNSSGVCSVSAPAMPATYGNSCPSVPATNACGMAGSGTILCNGTCSAITPSDTLCLPTVTLSADPTRVRKDTSTKLTWSSSGATSCTLTGQNGFSSTALSGTNVDSTPLDAQTTFTLTCSNTYSPPSVSASVIVNLVPSYIEQ